MARYKGPRVKKMRSLGVDLPGLSRKSTERRPYPPGQHGNVGHRKTTEYGRRLMEKQKLRYNYGVSERQLRRLVSEARSSKEPDEWKELCLFIVSIPSDRHAALDKLGDHQDAADAEQRTEGRGKAHQILTPGFRICWAEYFTDDTQNR